jgi:tRNA wybutosine-synthesizing protein 1
MHVGHSRGRLDRDTMPEHEAVRSFAEDVLAYMPDHDVLKEQPASRVALLAPENDTWVPKLKPETAFWKDDPLAGD